MNQILVVLTIVLIFAEAFTADGSAQAQVFVLSSLGLIALGAAAARRFKR